MTKNKDKRISGFEPSGKEWVIGWTIIILAILLGLGIGYVIISIGDLEQQLQSCQDKVPIEPRPCFKLKEGVSMNTPKDTWNHGEGVVFPRDFEEVSCEVIE